MKYPRVGSILRRKRNTAAKCKCGQVAKFRIDIQVNWFRGDDERRWACEEHKNDCDFLMAEGVNHD